MGYNRLCTAKNFLCTRDCEKCNYYDIDKVNKIENTITIGGKEYVKTKQIITRERHTTSKEHKCNDCGSLNITEYCNGQYKEEHYYCGSCGKIVEESIQNYCGYCGIKFNKD